MANSAVERLEAMPDCGGAASCRQLPVCVGELHRTRVIDCITIEFDSMRKLLHSSPGAYRIERNAMATAL